MTRHPIADASAERRRAIIAEAREVAAARRAKLDPNLDKLDEADRMALAIELIDEELTERRHAMTDHAALLVFVRAEILAIVEASPFGRARRLRALERMIQARAPGPDDPQRAVDSLIAAVLRGSEASSDTGRDRC